jgi:SAM-dependent methyltransferase
MKNQAVDTYNEEASQYQQHRKSFWSDIYQNPSNSWGGYYHNRLQITYRHIVPVGATVLELGCGRGDLLAAFEPSVGVGIDFCPEALEIARVAYPGMEFVLADAHKLALSSRTFDYIIVSDLVNDLWDVQDMLAQLQPYCTSATRLIFNFYSHLWNAPLRFAQKLGIATPNLPQNWLTRHDMANLLEISGFQPLREWEEIVSPLPLFKFC